MIHAVKSNDLDRFINWFIKRSFEDLMVPYMPSGPYLSDVLVRCTRTDTLYRFQDIDGQTLYQLADTLLAHNQSTLARPPHPESDEDARNLKSPRSILLAKESPDPPKVKDGGKEPSPLESPIPWDQAEESSYQRHLGELALFLSGLFRNHLDRGGYLSLYLGEGERAYRKLADSTEGGTDKRRQVYEDLSHHFEQYAEALDYMGKVYWSSGKDGAEGFHRFREFLDEDLGTGKA